MKAVRRSVAAVIALTIAASPPFMGSRFGSVAPNSPTRAVASAPLACPAGTGVGGPSVNTSTSALSRGGHGCVIIEWEGGGQVFEYTGALQTWSVPNGVTSATFHLVGAGGGGGFSGIAGSNTGPGGGGGYAFGTLAVDPGHDYDVIVGEGGRHHCVADLSGILSDVEARRNFSFGGGAAGFGDAALDCSWASGGGRSAIRVPGGGHDFVTAGGGGGAGFGGVGGAGGGLVGLDGTGRDTDVNGKGGGQDAGGAGGTGDEAGYDGVQYAGGPAGLNTGRPSEGGGGGGGYYGGGGGGDNGGGGGGSSFVGSLRGLTDGCTNGGTGATSGARSPRNDAAPTVSGITELGQTLTATIGTWCFASTTAFQWQRFDGTTWIDITGATSPTYDIGVAGSLRVRVTSTNPFGTTTAPSVSTSAVVDTSLSDLVTSAGSLTPPFSPGTLAYSVTVSHSTTTITVTPTRTDAATTLTVDGATVASGSPSDPIALIVGTNVVTVSATNNGVTTDTVITIIREAAPTPVPIPCCPPTPTTTTVVESTGPADTRPTRPDGSTPAVPVTATPERLPTTPLGDVVVTRDGELVTASIREIDPGAWQVVGPDFRMTLRAQVTEATDAGSREILLTRDRLVELAGDGFRPESLVDLWLFSSPRFLGTVRVGPDGSFESVFTLPGDVPVGVHTLQANGITPDDALRSVNLGVRVVADSRLPSTGNGAASAESWALLLIAIGIVGLSSRRCLRHGRV